jgi:hypothetical protein
MSVLLLVASGILLAGCADKNRFASLTGSDGKGGGACSAFEAPKYQIKGKTPYDQQWADKTTEAGVAGCQWQRPAPRPPEMDAPPPTPVAATAPASKPKRHWYDRFRRKAKTS